MREILFRGKRVDNGEWVEGLLIINKDYNEKIMKYGICEIDEVVKIINWCDEETIGEFTGLRDQNGTRIFEGDVVKFSHPAFKKQEIGKVIWSDNELGFELETQEHFNAFGYASEFYEIIGNVHDNPELLELDKSKRGGE